MTFWHRLFLPIISSCMFYSLWGLFGSINFFYSLNLPIHSKTEYDFIIVGLGSAGSVVAAGIPSDNVLVLEAGAMTPSLYDLPMMGHFFHSSSIYDWNYYTVPQMNACGGLKNQQSHWPLGRIVGGSFKLNFLIHHRGHPSNYDNWFGTTTNYDKDILPYFLEYEENLKPTSRSYRSTITETIMAAGKQSGYCEFTRPNITTQNGWRFTSSHYYLQNFREGHEVVTNAHVVKVIFSETAPNVANGIQFHQNNILHTVHATKGVILSAGAVNTPAILLRSGIGSKKDLDDLKISNRVDLPGVGMNLADHIGTGVDLVILNETLMGPSILIGSSSIYQYFINNDGPLSTPGCVAMSFLNISSSAPDLQFLTLPIGFVTDGGVYLRKTINIKDNIWEKYFQPLVGLQTLSILPLILQPKSRGYVKLRDANPFSVPIINPNYLQHDDDINTIYAGIRILQQIVETPAFQKYGAEINPKLFPGCEQYEFNTKDYWYCYIRQLTLTIYHPSGTCKMGADDDKDAVVSYKDFHVLQTDRLFVVDASIMPNPISGNPNGAVGMLAKRFLSQLKIKL